MEAVTIFSFGMCSGCVRDAFGIEPFIERYNIPKNRVISKSQVSPIRFGTIIGDSWEEERMFLGNTLDISLFRKRQKYRFLKVIIKKNPSCRKYSTRRTVYLSLNAEFLLLSSIEEHSYAVEVNLLREFVGCTETLSSDAAGCNLVTLNESVLYSVGTCDRNLLVDFSTSFW